MSDELNIVQSATLNIDGVRSQIISQRVALDVSSSILASGVVSIGTSEEDLSFGDISTVGVFYIWNLDATNYVRFGPKSGGSMVAIGRLPARATGEEPFINGPIKLEPSTVIRCVANNAACKVGFICLSN